MLQFHNLTCAVCYGKLILLPVESREPEAQGRLLDEVGVVGAVALIKAVLTLALAVASLKYESQALVEIICISC